MKRTFDGDLNILDRAEEKLSELDDKLIETSQTEAQKNTHTNSTPEHSIFVGQYGKAQHTCSWNTRRTNEAEEIFEVVMAKDSQN